MVYKQQNASWRVRSGDKTTKCRHLCTLYPSRVSSRKFSWGGSSLGSSLFFGGAICGAVTSLACHESACAYELILVVISLGGKLASLGGKLPPCPPPVDETLPRSQNIEAWMVKPLSAG